MKTKEVRARRRGRPARPGEYERLAVDLPVSLLQRLRQIASEDDRSITQTVRRLIQRALKAS